MGLLLEDEMLGTFVPIMVYWAYSGVYVVLLARFSKYQLHSKDDDQRNIVSKQDVVKGVLLQQALQATCALLAYTLTTSKGKEKHWTPQGRHGQPSFIIQAKQFFIAMVVFDTWQYFAHRFMHANKYMYRRFHSWHHRVAAPYAFAAQYNHPVDGLLIETLSGAWAYLLSGMSPRSSIYFFSFATIKGIDDHCGMLIPGNVFHLVFRNNTAYHEIHHQLGRSKYNLSQPFFVTWDKVLGTYMDYRVEKRRGGGLVARAVTDSDVME